VPFISDKVDDFMYPWECKCSLEGVDDCTICKEYFVLQKKNTDFDVLEITSLDIRPVNGLQAEDNDGIGKKPIQPVPFFSDHYENKPLGVPIVKLARNQEINIRFDVQKGIGKMHAKWAPCSLATFHPDP
jgi:DNA-directed RNA polymerase alpha subunit